MISLKRVDEAEAVLRELLDINRCVYLCENEYVCIAHDVLGRGHEQVCIYVLCIAQNTLD